MTLVFGMFFELFDDTGAKERGPELGPSLTNSLCLSGSSTGPDWLIQIARQRFGPFIFILEFTRNAPNTPLANRGRTIRETRH